jgi:hypothetical protein
MDAEALKIDDQPVNSAFFGQGDWLSDFITPEALEVRALYEELTADVPELSDKIVACWHWVASEVKYTPFVEGQIRIGSYVSNQKDLWQYPSMVIKTRIGNCANKTFLLTSLLRNVMDHTSVFAVLGNLHQPGEGGHAWVEATINGTDYILETTRADMTPFTNKVRAEIYEDVMYFNDRNTYAVEQRTLLQPFCAVYVDWLKDYLDWNYIETRRQPE